MQFVSLYFLVHFGFYVIGSAARERDLTSVPGSLSVREKHITFPSLFLDPAAGDSVDWYTAIAGVRFAYTTELRGSDFLLPPDQIVPSGEEMWEAHKVAIDKVIQVNNGAAIKRISALEGILSYSFFVLAQQRLE
jgi:hypothetical protein